MTHDGPAAGGTDLTSLARELAHEFTNQFGVIRNFAELAAEDVHEPQRLREDLAAIQDAAQRGLELTSRLNELRRDHADS